MSSRVAVIGGSIAGCAVAIGLRGLGCDVTVYERSQGALAGRGLGIGIPTMVLPTLAEFLEPDLRSNRLGERAWFIPDGSPTGRVGWRQSFESVFTNWGVVWRALRAKVPDSVFRQRAEVLAVGADGTVVTDAGEECYDLVVGADGYRSIARGVVDPASRITYSGYVVWRGDFPIERLPEPVPPQVGTAANLVALSSGHVMAYPIPDASGDGERFNWVVYRGMPDRFADPTSLPPGRLDDDLFAAFRDAVAQLPPYWAELVQRTPRESLAVQPIYDAEVDRYVTGRLALAGDAGCLARPHTGAGALKALQDGQSLARAYREHGDWPAALAQYDAERTRTGRALAAMGRRLGVVLVTDTPDWSAMAEPDFSGVYQALQADLPYTAKGV
ncbi:MAG TPA: NAD-binding protein [Pseudonocardiaceae bacterium]|jgi:2-polyprenyl-6-methoxyphenol hydroxylase-like FAD-dependent oxidoreductase|nr:NAD-binding protein [Pseudonocardiaceae bacterium]